MLIMTVVLSLVAIVSNVAAVLLRFSPAGTMQYVMMLAILLGLVSGSLVAFINFLTHGMSGGPKLPGYVRVPLAGLSALYMMSLLSGGLTGLITEHGFISISPIVSYASAAIAVVLGIVVLVFACRGEYSEQSYGID